MGNDNRPNGDSEGSSRDAWEDIASSLRGSQGITFDLGIKAYLWIFFCGMVGLGCFFYGIYGSSELVFYTAFGVWGVALIPIVALVITKTIEVTLGSPLVVGIIFGSALLGGLVYLLSGTSIETVELLLTNPDFIRLLIIIAIIFGLLVTIGLIAFVASGHGKSFFRMMESKLEASKELDLVEQDSALKIQEIKTRREIELKRLEIEHEQAVIRRKQLELDAERNRLLIATEKLRADQKSSLETDI